VYLDHTDEHEGEVQWGFADALLYKGNLTWYPMVPEHVGGTAAATNATTPGDGDPGGGGGGGGVVTDKDAGDLVGNSDGGVAVAARPNFVYYKARP
jgi:hypothetical protein